MRTIIFLTCCIASLSAVGQETKSKADTVIIYVVESPAEYIGGEKALYKYIDKSLTYPKSARQEKINGKVTVRFIIEKDGSVSNVKVEESLHPECDAEAVRIIQGMPKWKPGSQDGRPVKCQFLLPIAFGKTSS